MVFNNCYACWLVVPPITDAPKFESGQFAGGGVEPLEEESEEEEEEDDDETPYEDMKQFLRLSDIQSERLLVDMVGDGSCLFRAISFWRFGDQSSYDRVRDRLTKYMNDHFEEIYTSDFAAYFKDRDALREYIHQKSLKHSRGDLTTLYVASLAYAGLKFKIWSTGEDKRHANNLRNAGVSEKSARDLLCLVHENITDDQTFLSNVWSLGGHAPEKVLNLYYHEEHYNVLQMKHIQDYSFLSPNNLIHLEEDCDSNDDPDFMDVDETAGVSDTRTEQVEESKIEAIANRFVSESLPCCSTTSNGDVHDGPNQIDYTFEMLDEFLGKRKMKVKLSIIDAEKLLAYRCKHEGIDASFCQFEVCAATGVALAAKQDVWGPEVKEGSTGTSRLTFMRNELKEAMSIANGKPIFKHKVGQYFVCHDAWKKLYGFPKTTLNRWKNIIKMQKLVDIEENNTNVSLNQHADKVEWAPRDESQARRTAYGWMFHYVKAACDSMPVGYITKVNQNEVESAKAAVQNAKTYQNHMKELKQLETKVRKKCESASWDVDVEARVAQAKKLLNDEFKNKNFQLLENMFDEKAAQMAAAEIAANEEEAKQAGEVVDMSMFFGELNADGTVDVAPPNFFSQNEAPEQQRDMTVELGTDELCQYRVPYATKKEVYDEYVQFCVLWKHKSLSMNSFTDMWKEDYKFVKLSKVKGTFSMCGTCSDYTGKMKVAKSDKEYCYWKQMRVEHLDQQRAQRKMYYQNRIGAQLQKEYFLSIIMDAMDQAKTELPVVMRRTSSNKAFLKQKLMGAIAHGHGKYLYVSHSPVITGADFTLECLWRTLLKLESSYLNNNWTWPPVLNLQFDNCRDNKNKCVVAFCSLLVESEIFREVNFNFLMVGHTHEDIDQMFSTISRRFLRLCYHPRRKKCVTFKDFVDEINDCFAANEENAPQCVEFVAATHDFWGWLGDAIDPKFGNMDGLRSFKFRKQTEEEENMHLFREFDGRCVVFGKRYMTDADSNCTPNRQRFIEKGPICPLMMAAHFSDITNVKPGLSQFKDYTKPPTNKKTKIDPSHSGKSNKDIHEMKLEALREIMTTFDGATPQQSAEFLQMIDEKAWHVDELSDDVKKMYVTDFQWLINPNALPREVEEQDFDGKSDDDDVWELTSHNEQNQEAKKAKKLKELQKKNQAEMEKSTNFEAIAKGDFLLCKTVKEEGDKDIEWLIGQSLWKRKNHPLTDKNLNNHKVKVQWFRSDGDRNDLNGKFVMWVSGGTKETQKIARSAVQFIGLQLTGQGKIYLNDLKKIGQLGIGFSYDEQEKKLIWVGATEAEAEADGIEQEGVGI